MVLRYIIPVILCWLPTPVSSHYTSLIAVLQLWNHPAGTSIPSLTHQLLIRITSTVALSRPPRPHLGLIAAVTATSFRPRRARHGQPTQVTWCPAARPMPRRLICVNRRPAVGAACLPVNPYPQPAPAPTRSRSSGSAVELAQGFWMTLLVSRFWILCSLISSC